MTTKVSFDQGSLLWEKWRKLLTETVPGQYSALYFLNQRLRGLEDKIPMTPETHYAMCLIAERATGIPEIDEAQVLMMALPRGLGKSGLVTAGLPILRLLQHDGYSIGIANETLRLAEEFLSQIKLEFETNEFLRFLFPERVPTDFRKTKWSSDEIIVHRDRPRPSPSVRAMGVGAAITGMHADEFILDDIISREAAESAMKGTFTAIEDTNFWVKTVRPLLSNPMRDPITVIHTPWYEGDTYHFIECHFGNLPIGTDLSQEDPDFETIWRLKLPSGEVQHHRLYRRGNVAVFRRPAIENGRSIFPARYTLEELEEMAAQPENAAFFQSQFMLNPSGGHASEFELEWLKNYKIEGSSIQYRDQQGRIKYELWRDLTVFISVDPAFSDSQTAARTAIPVVGTNGSELFLLEDFADYGMGTYDIAHKIAGFVQQYRSYGCRIHKIFIETIVGQVALVEPLKRTFQEFGVQVPIIEEISSHGRQKKDMRIYGLQPYFRKGLFYVHASHHNFRREYSIFPRGTMRDVLDAMSFQRDEWERVFTRIARSDTDSKSAHERAIERVRKWGRRGVRRAG